MAYVLLNADNSINWVGDYLDENLFLDDVKILEFPDKTELEITNNVDPINAVWDPELECAQDVRTHRHLLKLVNKWFSSEEERLAEYAAVYRRVRNRMLAYTDGRVASYETNPYIDDAMVESWKNSRQALRDVPQQAGFPETVDWPDKPMDY